jgi:hypothetical protein
MGARGSVVGWGTMLQAGRSPVQVPDEVDVFNVPNPSSCIMTLGSTQPLTEMSTRNFPAGKKRPARRADNLTETMSQKAWKCGSLSLSQPYGPLRPVTGITLPLPVKYGTLLGLDMQLHVEVEQILDFWWIHEEIS